MLEVNFARFRGFEKAGLVGRAEKLHGGEGGIILREPFAGHELACEEERIVVRVEVAQDCAHACEQLAGIGAKSGLGLGREEKSIKLLS